MTALASWCLSDRWISDLPVDEAVPMLFQMGPETPDIKRMLRGRAAGIPPSLLPMLQDPAQVVPRELFWRMNHRQQRALRAGRWKYLKVDEHEYLFDVEADERERANRAKAEPALLAELRAEWEAWNETVAPIPDDAIVSNDLVYALAPQQKAVVERAGGGLRLVQGRTLATWQIYLNYAKAPLDNLKVRQAMCHAVDRDEFNRLTTAGIAEPTVQTLPKGH